MKIILLGANGDIGRAVCCELDQRHQMIKAGRSSGDVLVDMSDRTSVDAMYAQTGPVDAMIVTAGDVHFDVLTRFTGDQYMQGLRDKVMGQVNVVLSGLTHLNDGGSFTLTSGILDRDPIRMGSGAAMANGALAGFVTGAAIEMPRGIRINVVSPGLLDVSVARYGEWFPGHNPVNSRRVGRAYAKSVEGPGTGKMIPVD